MFVIFDKFLKFMLFNLSEVCISNIILKYARDKFINMYIQFDFITFYIMCADGYICIAND